MIYYFYCSYCKKVIEKHPMKHKNIIYIPGFATHVHRKNTYPLTQIDANEADFIRNKYID
jgi:hypothetical protein